jgi:hypothetical protein
MCSIKVFSLILLLNVSIILSDEFNIYDRNRNALDSFVDKINYEIHDEKEEMIDAIFGQLKMVLEFLEENYDSVNIDGLFGIRIAEGMVNNIEKHSTESMIQKYNIRDIESRLKTLASKIFEIEIRRSPEYAQNFKILIGKPYKASKLNHKQNKLFARLDFGILKSIKSNPILVTNFNEQFSDKCYSILLDKYRDPIDNCQTNDECLEYYTASDSSG